MKNFIRILFCLVGFSATAKEENLPSAPCDQPIRDALLKEATKKKIGDLTFLDASFSEVKPNVYEVPTAGDVPDGLYSIN